MRALTRLMLAALTLTACGAPSDPLAETTPRLSVRVQPSPVRVGQNLSFTVALSGTPATWNLALFVEDPEGRVERLLPNRTAEGNVALPGGTTRTFPSNHLVLTASSPAGVHTVLAYASPRPLDLSAVSTDKEGQVFATVKENRQGKGSLEASFLSILRLYNPGTQALTTFTVTP